MFSLLTQARNFEVTNEKHNCSFWFNHNLIIKYYLKYKLWPTEIQGNSKCLVRYKKQISMLDISGKIMINFVKGKTEPFLTNYNTSPSQYILTATPTNIPILTKQDSIVLKTSVTSHLPNPLTFSLASSS